MPRKGQRMSSAHKAKISAALKGRHDLGKKPSNTEARFFSLIKKDRRGCEYLIALNSHRSKSHSRYFSFGDTLWIASRLVYTLRHGPIPKGINVCHTCDHNWCLRDDHHFLGTQQDNIDDMVKKGRQRGVPNNKHALGHRWKRSPESVSKMRQTKRAKYGSSGRSISK